MLKKTTLLLVLVVALCAAMAPAFATDWVLDRDFSKTTNPNGQWTYGVYLEDWFNTNGYPDGWYTWGTKQYWPGSTTVFYWGNPGGDLGAGCIFYMDSDTPSGGPDQWWAPHKVMLHPAGQGSNYAPVVRWTAPSNMTVSVSALFYGCETATTDVHVLLNGDMADGGTFSGTHLMDGVIDGNYGYEPLSIPASGTSNNVPYNADVALLAGDKLDFVVGYGGNGYASDLTGLDVTITEVVGQGILSGVVTANTTGHPTVAGALVEAVGTTKSITTGSNGQYQISVPPGTYTVRATHPSLQPKEYTGISVAADQTATRDFDMDLRVAMTYYVNGSTGNDSNDGLSRANAWKTIQNGNSKDLLPGDIVKVAPGLYESTTLYGVHIKTSGDAIAKMKYVKDDGAGSGNVVIDAASQPVDVGGAKMAVTIDADYVIFDGFEVKNGMYGICIPDVVEGNQVRHHSVEIANCLIHGQRPGQPNGSTSTGLSGYLWCAGICNSIATSVVNRNNVIYDIGHPELPNLAACIASPYSSDIKMYNNTLLGAQSGIAIWGWTSGEFKNNIIANMRGYGIDSSYAAYITSGAVVRGNNFYFDNTADYGWDNPTPATGEYNCNPKLAAGYTLDTGSPAINAGVDVGLVFQGSNPDIGAFETASTVAAPDAILQGTVTANVTGHPAITRATISAGGVTLGATDLQGNYKIPVAAGTYSLTAARGGFTSKSASVTVAASATGTKDFDLSKAAGSTWYVNASGNDSNDGQTPSTAWATINRGDVLGVVKPGDTVMVAAGNYPQTASPGAFLGVRLSKCYGEAAAPITYKADGVVVINQSGIQADDLTNMGINIDADYTTLGQANSAGVFDVSNCEFGAFVSPNRRGSVVANCYFHDIMEPGSTGYLAAAAGVYSAGSLGTTIRNNVFFNIGVMEASVDPTAGVMLSGCADAKIYNNTMQIVQRGIHVIDGSVGVIVRNNIFEYFFVCGIYGGVLPVELTHSNNLFFGDTGTLPPNWGGYCTPGMMEFSTGDTALNYDFTLFSGSPAINMGVDVGLPYNGPAPDLGAYETTDTAYPSQFGIVKGTVRYRSSGLPVEGATVSVAGLSLAQVTGADGAYGFILDQPGTWTVQAVKQGYAPKWADLNIVFGQALTQDFYLSPGTGGVWDIVQDWSLTNPPTGQWSFGDSDVVDSGSVAQLPDAYDFGQHTVTPYPGLQAWTRWLDAPGGAGLPMAICNTTDELVAGFYPPHTACLHPGGGSETTGKVYCVARWTAPSAGWYEAYVTFGADYYTGETTDCHILVNGTSVMSGVLDGAGTLVLPYADRFQLAAGGTIDAFVGPNGAHYSDTTPVSFTLIGVDTTPANVATIAEAKAYADNKLVAVTTAQIVTVGTGTFVDGSCYIEDAERTTGIKVVLDGPSSIAQGQKITFQGYMGTDDNGERFIRITSLTPQGTGSVGSLGMTNTAIGAGKTGLLVRVWGTVTETDPLGAFVILDDGSGSSIKVLKDASITKAMGLNKMVGVTGPVSLVANGPTMTTVVRARSNNDVVAYN